MRKEMKLVYVADDDVTFLSEQECLDHEAVLRMGQKVRDLTAFLYSKTAVSECDCEEAATAILQRYELVEKGEGQPAAKQPEELPPHVRALLEELQWQHLDYDDYNHKPQGWYCPDCGGAKEKGHTAMCDIARVLGKESV